MQINISDAYRALLRHGIAVSHLESNGPPAPDDPDAEAWWQAIERRAERDGLLIKRFLWAGAAHVFVAPAVILRTPDGSEYDDDLVWHGNGGLIRRIRNDWGETLRKARQRSGVAIAPP